MVAGIIAGIGAVATVVWQGIKEVSAFVKDWVFWMASSAPYPIRVATWIIMFMSSSWLFAFFFSLGGICTTQGELYSPDTIPIAIDLNFANFALANDLNYTWVNATNSSDSTEVTYNDVFFVWIASWLTYGVDINDSEGATLDSVSSLYSTEKAVNYNNEILEKATPYATQNGIARLDCDHENTIIKIAGINVFDPTLWVVLGVLLMLFPLYMKLIK